MSGRTEYDLHTEIHEEAKHDAAECGLGDHDLLSQVRWQEIVLSRALKRATQGDRRTRKQYHTVLRW